jgi:hypothetical protein
MGEQLSSVRDIRDRNNGPLASGIVTEGGQDSVLPLAGGKVSSQALMAEVEHTQFNFL